jgi:hypothetical protein
VTGDLLARADLAGETADVFGDELVTAAGLAANEDFTSTELGNDAQAWIRRLRVASNKVRRVDTPSMNAVSTSSPQTSASPFFLSGVRR